MNIRGRRRYRAKIKSIRRLVRMFGMLCGTESDNYKELVVIRDRFEKLK